VAIVSAADRKPKDLAEAAARRMRVEERAIKQIILPLSADDIEH
jgi:hypothetical protein